jgi:hypothetical protein
MFILRKTYAGSLRVCHSLCVVIKHIVESRTVNKHNRYRVWYYKCIKQYIIVELPRNVIYIYIYIYVYILYNNSMCYGITSVLTMSISSVTNVIYIHYNYMFRPSGPSSGCVVRSQIKLYIGPLRWGMGGRTRFRPPIPHLSGPIYSFIWDLTTQPDDGPEGRNM